jgi:hypothetical protein
MDAKGHLGRRRAVAHRKDRGCPLQNRVMKLRIQDLFQRDIILIQAAILDKRLSGLHPHGLGGNRLQGCEIPADRIRLFRKVG